MKKSLSKIQATEKIKSFFSQSAFDSQDVKKIKSLAMSHRIKLKPFKGNFCKSCLSSLKGKIRVSKAYKTIICEKCNYRNKIPLKN